MIKYAKILSLLDYVYILLLPLLIKLDNLFLKSPSFINYNQNINIKIDNTKIDEKIYKTCVYNANSNLSSRNFPLISF